jgi:DNA-binding phage protein
VADEGEIKQRFSQLEAWLDERARRLWAAAESVAHGRGGISLVARASGVSRRAIAVGLAELRKKPERSQRTRLPIVSAGLKEQHFRRFWRRSERRNRRRGTRLRSRAAI